MWRADSSGNLGLNHDKLQISQAVENLMGPACRQQHWDPPSTYTTSIISTGPKERLGSLHGAFIIWWYSFHILSMVISVISHCVIICFSGIPAPSPQPALESLLLQVRNQLQSPSPLLSLAWSETAGGWAACNIHTMYQLCVHICTYIYWYIYIYMLHIQCIHNISFAYFAHINHEKTSTKLYARLGSSQDAPDTIHGSGRIGLDFSLSLRTSWFNQFNQQELHSCHVGS